MKTIQLKDRSRQFGRSAWHQLMAWLCCLNPADLDDKGQRIGSGVAIQGMATLCGPAFAASGLTFGLGHLGLQLNWYGLIPMWILLYAIILTLDRALSSPYIEGQLKILRIGILIILALLGSIFYDLAIFNNDIVSRSKSNLNKELTRIGQQFELQIAHEEHKLKQLKQAFHAEQVKLDSLSANVVKEIEGRSGSGRVGLGPAALAKQTALLEAKSNFDSLVIPRFEHEQQQINEKINALHAKSAQQQATITSNQKNGILNRLILLHEIMEEDVMAKLVALLLILTSAGLEAMPLIVKESYKPIWESFRNEVEAQEEERLANNEAKRGIRNHERQIALSHQLKVLQSKADVLDKQLSHELELKRMDMESELLEEKQYILMDMMEESLHRYERMQKQFGQILTDTQTDRKSKNFVENMENRLEKTMNHALEEMMA
ncbi:MAG: DUF4407 domain-containing protein [Flammeovirgaceae bacterium]